MKRHIPYHERRRRGRLIFGALVLLTLWLVWGCAAPDDDPTRGGVPDTVTHPVVHVPDDSVKGPVNYPHSEQEDDDD